MNSNDTFFLHGEIDVKPILDIIETNNLDWDEYTDRQKKFSGAHLHTKTIPIIFDKSLNFDHFKIIPTEHFPIFNNQIELIENKIKDSTGEDGKIMRALLVKLDAKKNISPHVDAGKSLVNCRRVHLALQTNDYCFFTVGDEKKNLKIGELWEINNDKKKHSVENLGEKDRIHLIVDWVEKTMIQS